MLKVRRMPFITYLIIAANIIMFLVMTFAGGTENTAVLLKFGAKYNPLIIQGQWWRLITPMFIHIGLEHIVVNMVTLYFIGIDVERFFGHLRFAIIYFISGIMGNIASFAFNPNVVSAGASTAIFGLLGAFLMLGISFRNNPYISALARQFLLFVILNLAFSFTGGVDLFGHLGGLVGGFLAAMVVGAPKIGKNNFSRSLISGVALAALAFMCLMMGY